MCLAQRPQCSDASEAGTCSPSVSSKLLTEHHLTFLNLKGRCTGSSESTLVKTPHCWKSHVTAQILSHLQGDAHYSTDLCQGPSSMKCKRKCVLEEYADDI